MAKPGIRLICALAAAGLLPIQAVTGGDSRGQFGVRGAALVSCATYAREREARSQVYHVIAAWMDGYITATNQYADDTYDVASFESTELLAALVGEYCKKHPETPVFAVVNTLVKQFARDRLHSPSKKVEIVVGDRKVQLYEEVVGRIQEKLAEEGYYAGDISSSYGPQVRKAMQAFQASIGLEATGFPDQLTLWRLFKADR